MSVKKDFKNVTNTSVNKVSRLPKFYMNRKVNWFIIWLSINFILKTYWIIQKIFICFLRILPSFLTKLKQCHSYTKATIKNIHILFCNQYWFNNWKSNVMKQNLWNMNSDTSILLNTIKLFRFTFSNLKLMWGFKKS